MPPPELQPFAGPPLRVRGPQPARAPAPDSPRRRPLPSDPPGWRSCGPLAAAAFAAAAAITALFAANALLSSPDAPLSQLLGAWGNAAGGILCALVCIARARRAGPDRLGWSLVGAGVAAWALGNTIFSVAYEGAASVPVPSPADALFVLFYPLTYVGIGLLVRRRMRHLGAGLWLDGLIATVATTSLLGVFVLDAVIAAYDGRISTALVVGLAYPIGDLVLFALVAGALAMGAPHLSRGAVSGALAALLFVLADSVFVVGSAQGTYAVGGVLDVGWLAGAVLAAHAALVWDPRQKRRGRRPEHRHASIAVPIASGAVTTGLLLANVFVPVAASAEIAALATLALVVARMGLSLRENRRMLDALHADATTDALTGLGNRRRLFDDLAAALAEAPADRPVGLVVFDLDGFKTYNDTYGHGGGDRLLRRIGESLREGLGVRGCGYRLGGDEFCAVVRDGRDAERLAAHTARLIAQGGEGFRVTASHGAALSGPGDDADALMRRADRRMYEAKHGRRPSAASQAVDALLAIVDERHPSLSGHVASVASLAHRVGAELGLRDADLDAVDHAAALHDVGKVAVPDAILDRPGSLDADEWSFMRQHTVIGERVLLAVPALRAAAPLVRASHERWDGRGYPDGRAAEQIPLGAAIIAACDALDAMLEERPYQPARSLPEALAELRRCSGTQFAPHVVEAVATVVARRECAAPAAG